MFVFISFARITVHSALFNDVAFDALTILIVFVFFTIALADHYSSSTIKLADINSFKSTGLMASGKYCWFIL